MVCPTDFIGKDEDSPSMRKRSFVILLLPIVILLWIIGWSTFWIGSQQATSKAAHGKEPDNVHVTVRPLQEQEIPA